MFCRKTLFYKEKVLKISVQSVNELELLKSRFQLNKSLLVDSKDVSSFFKRRIETLFNECINGCSTHNVLSYEYQFYMGMLKGIVGVLDATLDKTAEIEMAETLGFGESDYSEYFLAKMEESNTVIKSLSSALTQFNSQRSTSEYFEYKLYTSHDRLLKHHMSRSPEDIDYDIATKFIDISYDKKYKNFTINVVPPETYALMFSEKGQYVANYKDANQLKILKRNLDMHKRFSKRVERVRAKDVDANYIHRIFCEVGEPTEAKILLQFGRVGNAAFTEKFKDSTKGKLIDFWFHRSSRIDMDMDEKGFWGRYEKTVRNAAPFAKYIISKPQSLAIRNFFVNQGVLDYETGDVLVNQSYLDKGIALPINFFTSYKEVLSRILYRLDIDLDDNQVAQFMDETRVFEGKFKAITDNDIARPDLVNLLEKWAKKSLVDNMGINLSQSEIRSGILAELNKAKGKQSFAENKSYKILSAAIDNRAKLSDDAQVIQSNLLFIREDSHAIRHFLCLENGENKSMILPFDRNGNKFVRMKSVHKNHSWTEAFDLLNKKMGLLESMMYINSPLDNKERHVILNGVRFSELTKKYRSFTSRNSVLFCLQTFFLAAAYIEPVSAILFGSVSSSRFVYGLYKFSRGMASLLNGVDGIKYDVWRRRTRKNLKTALSSTLMMISAWYNSAFLIIIDEVLRFSKWPDSLPKIKENAKNLMTPRALPELSFHIIATGLILASPWLGPGGSVNYVKTAGDVLCSLSVLRRALKRIGKPPEELPKLNDDED